MSRKLTTTFEAQTVVDVGHLRFFTETIEIGRVSPLAFFEAGESEYAKQRFYWQNATKTVTLIGIGHAAVLESDHPDQRFTHISRSWSRLRAALIKEEKDMDPVLFGGFSFDPKNNQPSEWSSFPAAFFVVPKFQMRIQDGKTAISINLVTTEMKAAQAFDELRDERDRLIHIAQVEEFEQYAKPKIQSLTEIQTAQYMQAVKNATQRIREGEAEKVVIARPVKLDFTEPVPAGNALHNISNEQQESYHFGLEKEDCFFFGATPERLIEIQNGQAYSACVAGSIPRGKSAAEDKLFGEALLQDSKNRQEHQFVVDMISDVFHSYCTNVNIPSTPKLMKIRDIQHLFTPVAGEIAHGSDIFRLVEALHPTPALGGLPKETALTIIREEEQMNRGYYAAPIGWTDTAGNGEFVVAIRSALLTDHEAYLYAGGGIVADSEPNSEYDETWVKFRPVLRALGGKLNG